MSENQPVLSEIRDAGSFKIGILTLNAPKRLNGLSIEMIRLLKKQLDLWANDDSIACVVLKGNGDRAFCAGGDIKALYQSATDDKSPFTEGDQFFAEEYQVNYDIHRFPKPMISWCHGVVMGGGIGLIAGARFRIGTPSLLAAMPEVTIGLFPDVGCSYLLNQVPQHIGYFMGLTGARIRLRDALELGIVTHALPDESLETLLNELTKLSWEGNEADLNRIDALIQKLAESCEGEVIQANSDIEAFRSIIEEAFKDPQASLVDIIDQLESTDQSTAWYENCLETLRLGSPLSAQAILRQLRLAKTLSLEEVFKSEWFLATACLRHPDFSEGVRALVIDKDQAPDWTHESFDAVSQDELDQLFASRVENPLANLGCS